MDCISSALKRSYAAVFGSDQRNGGPSKRNKTTRTHGVSCGQEHQEHVDRVARSPQSSPTALPTTPRKIARVRKATSRNRDRSSQEAQMATPETLANSPVPHGTSDASNEQSVEKQVSQAQLALLVDADTMEKMRTAIRVRHEIGTDAENCEVYLDILAKFKESAQQQIASLRAYGHSLHIAPDIRGPVWSDIQQQINLLISKYEEATQEEVKIRKALADDEIYADIQCLEVMVAVEDALIANEQLQEYPEDADFVPDQAFVEHFSVPELPYYLHGDRTFREETPELQQHAQEYWKERHALDEFTASRKNLQEAQADFDQRNRETAANFHLRHNKHHAAVPEEQDSLSFDLQQFQHNNALTRALIDAEARFAKAKAAAGQFEITTASQTSGFNDSDGDADPEARLSGVNRAAAGRLSAGMMVWLEDLPAVQDGTTLQARPQVPELDEWVAEPVGICDSASMVDYGRNKERIDGLCKAGEDQRDGAVDKWCGVYGRKRETFEKMHGNSKGWSRGV